MNGLLDQWKGSSNSSLSDHDDFSDDTHSQSSSPLSSRQHAYDFDWKWQRDAKEESAFDKNTPVNYKCVDCRTFIFIEKGFVGGVVF